jgi:hypothetical protein
MALRAAERDDKFVYQEKCRKGFFHFVNVKE